MKTKINILLTSLFLIGLMASPLTVLGPDESRPDMADLWFVHVKGGHSDEFEAALKEHLAFRAEKGDPRDWKTYTPIVGDDLGYYAIRSCCHEWSDFDAYRAWSLESGVGEHWNANVDQYVEGYAHYFRKVDFEHSNWPDDETNLNLVGVTDWELKPGSFAAVEAAKNKMSAIAKEHGWPRNWSWATSVGGTPTLTLVSPFENYAGMKPPEQSFAEFLMENMDSAEEAQALLGSFSGGLKKSKYTIYRLRDDLAMPSDVE